MTDLDARRRLDTPAIAAQAVSKAFAKVNARAWGIACGLLFGLGLVSMTWALVIQGGPVVGQHLGLLSKVLPGYSVTYFGGAIGFVYGFVIGYAFGRMVGVVYDRLLPSP
jgi:hypothetical protein